MFFLLFLVFIHLFFALLTLPSVLPSLAQLHLRTLPSLTNVCQVLIEVLPGLAKVNTIWKVAKMKTCQAKLSERWSWVGDLPSKRWVDVGGLTICRWVRTCQAKSPERWSWVGDLPSKSRVDVGGATICIWVMLGEHVACDVALDVCRNCNCVKYYSAT